MNRTREKMVLAITSLLFVALVLSAAFGAFGCANRVPVGPDPDYVEPPPPTAAEEAAELVAWLADVCGDLALADDLQRLAQMCRDKRNAAGKALALRVARRFAAAERAEAEATLETPVSPPDDVAGVAERAGEALDDLPEHPPEE